MLSMKLLIDTSAQRLVFAEASKDVVDFLFSLLALPVGTVVSLLGEESMDVGCVRNLYGSVVDLDATYVQPGAAKDVLLRPVVLSPVVNSLLGLPAPSTFLPDKPKTPLFRCDKQCCNNNPSRSSPFGAGFGSVPQFQFTASASTPKFDYHGDCKSCRNYATELPSEGAAAKGFVQGIVTYTVMDDLTVTPTSSMSSVAILNTFAVKDVSALREKTVQLGYSEGLAILKASLQSKTVLTDVFLGKKPTAGGSSA